MDGYHQMLAANGSGAGGATPISKISLGDIILVSLPSPMLCEASFFLAPFFFFTRRNQPISVDGLETFFSSMFDSLRCCDSLIEIPLP